MSLPSDRETGTEGELRGGDASHLVNEKDGVIYQDASRQIQESDVKRDDATAQQPVTPLQSQTPSQPSAYDEQHSSPPSSEHPTSGATSTNPGSPHRIKVRDLAHIQTIVGARDDQSASTTTSAATTPPPQYEISGMPIENIIEMVAGLLTKITTTNDVQHEHIHRQMPSPETGSPLSAQTSSVLAFHGKNVPSITILSYLTRINKYCPTSYEVFLSLLVYFDRMTEKVNAGPIQSMREATSSGVVQDSRPRRSGSTVPMEGIQESNPTQTATPPLSGEYAKQEHGAVPGTPHSRPHKFESPTMQSPTIEPELNLSHFFVVDSFNIHRLVIAGVTCASKFFSDIFYTNSRYAKVCLPRFSVHLNPLLTILLQVGGLPLPELNHLELQFLLLNDFRLSIPVEELEAYGTMLVEFYAREVAAQNQASQQAAQTPAQAPGQEQSAQEDEH